MGDNLLCPICKIAQSSKLEWQNVRWSYECIVKIHFGNRSVNAVGHRIWKIYPSCGTPPLYNGPEKPVE